MNLVLSGLMLIGVLWLTWKMLTMPIEFTRAVEYEDDAEDFDDRRWVHIDGEGAGEYVDGLERSSLGTASEAVPQVPRD